MINLFNNILNFIKRNLIRIILIILNVSFIIFILELVTIASLGLPMLLSRNEAIINLNSNWSRSGCGLAGGILLILLLILDYHALNYYKSPDDFYLKDEP